MMETQVEPAPERPPPGWTRCAPGWSRPCHCSTFWGWAGPLLVTAFGTYLRFDRLGTPRAVIFDETYYVPDALGILRFGVEHNYVSNRNGCWCAATRASSPGGGEFVVHPPFGKVLIAGGEWLFGLSPFGWRFAAAVVGSLSILLLARIARRMTRSTLLGCFAGLLLALDGLEFVMSRTALLDIFVMFWVLAAFGCLVVDRDLYRARLADAAAAAAEPAAPGPGRRGARRGGHPLVADGRRGLPGAGLRVQVERPLVRARVRRAVLRLGCRGAPDRWARQGHRPAGLLRISAAWPPFVALPLVAYLATWTGWFATSSGYDRNWARCTGSTSR